MENYIFLGGKKVELTDDQVAELRKSFGTQSVKLSELATGDVFRIEDTELVVLEQSGDTTAVICKKLLDKECEFGSSNNYDGSKVDKLCADWGKKIADAVGEDNLVMHTVDLTADDGLKDYGSVKRKASLLTAQQYRKYVEILDLHKADSWWWLATAFSTPTHNCSRTALCVSPSGYINSGRCGNVSGVRPFCILKSNIFVSK